MQDVEQQIPVVEDGYQMNEMTLTQLKDLLESAGYDVKLSDVGMLQVFDSERPYHFVTVKSDGDEVSLRCFKYGFQLKWFYRFEAVIFSFLIYVLITNPLPLSRLDAFVALAYLSILISSVQALNSLNALKGTVASACMLLSQKPDSPRP